MHDCTRGCDSYAPGHHLHHIPAGLTGRSPWGWRDAVVTEIIGGTLRLACVDGGEAEVWHHADLRDRLTVGDPVRLHERYRVLGTAAGWFCVRVVAGLGPVPEPEDVAAWVPEMHPGVVSLATGEGLPVDWVDPDTGVVT